MAVPESHRRGVAAVRASSGVLLGSRCVRLLHPLGGHGERFCQRTTPVSHSSAAINARHLKEVRFERCLLSTFLGTRADGSAHSIRKGVWGRAQAEHKIQSAGVGEELHLTLQKVRKLPLLCILHRPGFG